MAMLLQISSFVGEPFLHWFQSALDFFSSIGKDLIVNLVGALLGAILAIPTGLWLDRRVKQREQRERTKVVLQAVFDELDRNRTTLKEFLAKVPTEDVIDYPNLTNNAWQAAQSLEILSSSGDYELHKLLLGVYERIYFVSQIGQSLWSLFFSASHDFGALERKVKILTSILKEETRKTLPLIEEALARVQKRL